MEDNLTRCSRKFSRKSVSIAVFSGDNRVLTTGATKGQHRGEGAGIREGDARCRRNFGKFMAATSANFEKGREKHLNEGSGYRRESGCAFHFRRGWDGGAVAGELLRLACTPSPGQRASKLRRVLSRTCNNDGIPFSREAISTLR